VYLILVAFLAAQAQSPRINREMLAAHNQVRRRFGSPPLIWSDNLARVAQKWADTLVARRQFRHSGNRSLGENLFQVTGARATPAQVVAEWASEAKDYNRAANSCREVCGHYTQIVWRATRAVGCAVSRDKSIEVWVCNYDPPGNYVGRRP
jgi:pathogenesis-related protein 1